MKLKYVLQNSSSREAKHTQLIELLQVLHSAQQQLQDPNKKRQGVEVPIISHLDERVKAVGY